MVWQPVIFSFVLHSAFVISSQNDLGEIVFVNILFRHGDRTPVEPYPNDPYRNTSYWPAGWGELTNTGKRGHYELGQWLRKRYSDLLPTKYHKDDIYIQSTDVDRTLMSAYSNLAGLYEPDLNSNWSPDIKWQPIPVHTSPEQSDMVLAAKKPCPKYEKDLRALRNSEVFRKINLKNKDLYEYLSKQSGSNVTDLNSMEYLHNTLFIEKLYNFTLPSWTEKVFPQPMQALAELSFTVPCYNAQLARLKIGPLLSNMQKHMKKKIDGSLKPNRKAWIYSAHDTTVANFLQALKVFEAHCPPYLSIILLELRRKEDNYFVTLFYKNSSSVPPYLLTLPGCDPLCPYKEFVKLTSPVVPNDWEKECQDSQFAFAGGIYDSVAGISFISSALLATVFLLIILLVLHLYKRQYNSQKDFVYHSLKMELQS